MPQKVVVLPAFFPVEWLDFILHNVRKISPKSPTG